ncbi:MAG: hypothetical protein H6737_12970 [Alphaproteobacteria bacterium]|nr:hypothetical protein [Alphaproteobacteria bacterium]
MGAMLGGDDTLPGRASGGLLGPVLLLAAALVLRFAFLCDDAYISFRYSRNLARGLGLRYNPGEHVPVEGFSNLGWVLYGAVFEGLLLDPTFWLPLTSGLVGLLGVALVYVWGRRHLLLSEPLALVAAALLGWCPAWAVWSTGGLATVPFAVAVLWLFERAVLEPRSGVGSLVLAGLLVMLLRIEGAAWVALVLAVGAAWGREAPERNARLVRAAAVLAAAFVAYTAVRGWWFGALVPHTAMVKVAPGPDRLDRGLRYVALFALTFGTPLFLLGAAPGLLRERIGRALLAMVGGAAVFGTLAGGDFLPMGRLLVVGLPFGAWALALALQEVADRRGMRVAAVGAWAILAVGVLPAAGLSVAPWWMLAGLHVRYTDMTPMSELSRWVRTKENADGFAARGRALHDYAARGDSMVAPAIGAVGYYSDLFVYDQHGLVTRDVGLREVGPDEPPRSPGHDKYVDAAYFAPLHPTYLHTKIVFGRRSAKRMRELLDRWDVPIALQQEYAPRFHEIVLPGRSERHFLLLVQRTGPDEDAAVLWRNFFESTRTLAADL